MAIPKAGRINTLIDQIAAITEELTEIRDALQEKFDNASERYQEGEKGQAMEEQIGKLDDLILDLESAEDARPEI
jgi:hypothetical protein